MNTIQPRGDERVAILGGSQFTMACSPPTPSQAEFDIELQDTKYGAVALFFPMRRAFGVVENIG